MASRTRNGADSQMHRGSHPCLTPGASRSQTMCSDRQKPSAIFDSEENGQNGLADSPGRTSRPSPSRSPGRRLSRVSAVLQRIIDDWPEWGWRLGDLRLSRVGEMQPGCTCTPYRFFDGRTVALLHEPYCRVEKTFTERLGGSGRITMAGLGYRLSKAEQSVQLSMWPST